MSKLLTVSFLFVLASCGANYSRGSRVGVVTKLSYKGLIWDSWEGELVMGGLRSNGDGNLSANVFEFNATPEAAPAVEAAMKSGKRVELVYRQWAISPLTIGDSHVVYEVKESTP